MCIFCALIINSCIQPTKIYSAEETRLYIENATKYINEENVTIKICLENISEKIHTLGFDIKYDTAKLEFINAKEGKDMHASMQLAENIKEKNKVAIGAISINGFKNNGEYYLVTFKVLEEVQDIPLEITLTEACDSEGNNLAIKTVGGAIKISKEETQEKQEKTEEKQKIEKFEVTNPEKLEKLDKIIKENGNIEIKEQDIVTYETENNDILEILTDGTIIAKSDGVTNVKVKLNDETIGNIEIEIENGKVEKISAKTNQIESKEEIHKDRKNIITGTCIVIILGLILIFIIYKKTRRNK